MVGTDPCPPLTQGIAVELTIVVRPRVLIKTLVTAYKTDDSLPSKLLQVRQPVRVAVSV